MCHIAHDSVRWVFRQRWIVSIREGMTRVGLELVVVEGGWSEQQYLDVRMGLPVVHSIPLDGKQSTIVMTQCDFDGTWFVPQMAPMKFSALRMQTCTMNNREWGNGVVPSSGLRCSSQYRVYAKSLMRSIRVSRHYLRSFYADRSGPQGRRALSG